MTAGNRKTPRGARPCAILLSGLMAAAAFAQTETPPLPPLEPGQAPGTSIEIGEDGRPIIPGQGKPQVTLPTFRFLRSIEDRHGAAPTVAGEFTQTKQSDVFMEEIKSKGRFSYSKPDLFRCDFDPPDETTNLIIKDAIYVYTPSLGQAERYKFRTPEERDQQLHTMVLGFGFKTESITREYALRSSEDDKALADELRAGNADPAKTVLIEAIPVEQFRETCPFNKLRLWIDKTGLQPQKIYFEDGNGDKTTIAIHEVKFGAPMDAKIFEPQFPPGTEMIDRSDE